MSSKVNNLSFLNIKSKFDRVNKFDNTKNVYSFTKFFKLKFKSNVKNIVFSSNQVFNYNCFFMMSKKSFYFKDLHFKSMSLFMKSPYNSIFKFSIFPFFSVFGKPNEVRMGKGKGNKFLCKVFPINLGQVCAMVSFKKFSSIKEMKVFKSVFYYFSKLPNKFKISSVFLL